MKVKRLSTTILLFLLFFSILLLMFGCSQKKKKPISYQAKVLKAARSFLKEKQQLKILGKTKTPTGLIYEIKAENGSYLNVRAKDLVVTFANIGQIKKRKTKPVLNYKQAKQIALKWIKRRAIFKKFQLVKQQVNFDWPKLTYYTLVWQAKDLSSKDKFAKVTVDLVNGKVVSYGIGDPKWSMFCLPVKGKKGLTSKKLLQPNI